MRTFVSALVLCATLLASIMASQNGGAVAPPPARDASLDQLRSIQLPHIFSPAEQSMINNQLDILRLGIDLFLAQERQLSPEDQQAAFNNAWPILRCVFSKDFDAAPTCPGSSASQASTPTANAQPPSPQEPDAMSSQ